MPYNMVRTVITRVKCINTDLSKRMSNNVSIRCAITCLSATRLVTLRRRQRQKDRLRRTFSFTHVMLALVGEDGTKQHSTCPLRRFRRRRPAS